MIFAVVFVNGMTDAPNAVGGAVASGIVKPNRALLISGVFNFLGVAFNAGIFSRVTKNVYELAGVGGTVETSQICAVLCATIIFALFAWVFGIPTSESHALMGALLGTAFASGEVTSTVSKAFWSVVLGFFVSVVGGFVITFVLAKLLKKVCIKLGYKIPLVLAAALNSFLHGSQDGQKFIALALLFLNSDSTFTFVLLVATFMALGTICGGGRILKKICFEAVVLEEKEGVAAELGGTACLLFATLLGFPVSTTYTKTLALVGASSAGGISKVRFNDITKIVSTWVITYPCSAFLSYVLTKLLT